MKGKIDDFLHKNQFHNTKQKSTDNFQQQGQQVVKL